MESAEQLYLRHLDENIHIMNSLDIDRNQTEDFQSVYRLLMNRDRDTLFRIFRFTGTKHEGIPSDEEWGRIQFSWKSIIISASLQASIQRFTPMTMAQIFSLLFTIDDMAPAHFETGAHFLTDKMLALYASGIKEFDHISNPHVGKAIQLINSKLKSSRLSLKVVADKLEISSPYLSAIFHEEMDESITAYIHRKKIEASTEHLMFTNYSIQRIAEEYGYSSVTSYGRKFKEIMDTTPLKYRKNHAI
ncbi:helix-turn-helix domain-containing protein [Salimicrobium halophilum]|uniref:Helix-turn-helix domain-containing protein n=1 Tax=Salimicrobium halophilum TaxID=86666 RepID=A0A1G8SB50_9BACI|nr:response regulator transcription factor [Salimicrobium halophilum]SDJ26456.1 Helix-turn-helix domain-containing protein [Salimicrobium halophilum]